MILMASGFPQVSNRVLAESVEFPDFRPCGFPWLRRHQKRTVGLLME